ncbi:MAG: GGDEF domain-containing protein [Thermoguttaceae bacterium]
MLTAIWLVLSLGLLQLLAGIVIGWSLARRAGRDSSLAAASQLHRLAQDVHALIRDVHGQVDEHQTEIQRVHHQLQSDPDDPQSPAAAILRSISHVILVNQRLQDQLVHSEQNLERKESEIKTHMMAARTDPLTGLPNRRALDDFLRQQKALFQRNATRYGLIQLDVDHFKQLNDRWGHPGGDEILKAVASTIRRAARQTDLVARSGGEEFTVVLPDASPDSVIAAAERIRGAVEATPIVVQQTPVPVTISLGAALILDGETDRSLVDRSDAALYASKQDGRNCSHWHDGLRCRRITGGDQPPLDDGTLDHVQPAGWQDEPGWRRVCDDLRRSLSDFVRRHS